MSNKINNNNTQAPLDFLQMNCYVNKLNIEHIEGILWQMGALSISILEDEDSKPIYEPVPGEIILWDQEFIKVEVLFSVDFEREYIESELTRRAYVAGNLNDAYKDLYFEVIKGRLWEREYLIDAKEIKINDNLTIYPSHIFLGLSQEDKVINKRHFIVMDPGLAFGSGSHPTTSMCLDYLTKIDISDKTIFDFGCGTGILGICALKLGAKSACFLDHDILALEATKNNLVRNKINLSQTKLCRQEQLVTDEKFDIIIANIFSRVLMELKDLFIKHLSYQGIMVLSGILSEQASEIQSHFSNSSNYYNPISLIETNNKDGWVLLAS